jgi:hypothetical protein
MYRQDPPGRASIPDHAVIKAGTLSGILRAAKVLRTEFLDAL